MQTFSLTGLDLPPLPRPFTGNPSTSPTSSSHFNKNNQINFKRIFTPKISASRNDHHHHHHHNIVDENMIVLKLRIHEMKMFEKLDDEEEEQDQGHVNDDNEDEQVRVDRKWMKWEKYYYENDYGSDVCQAVGILQSMLMETRPSFALVMALVVFLSVPTSMTLVGLHFMELVKLLLLKA